MANMNDIAVEKNFMVRLPCDIYNEEYKACKSWRGRFNQYFIYGKYADCSKWQEDFIACTAYVESGNTSHLAVCVRHEEDRLAQRRQTTLANDVWQYRNGPPTEWFSELPTVFKSPLLESAEKELEDSVTKTKAGSFFERLYSRLID